MSSEVRLSRRELLVRYALGSAAVSALLAACRQQGDTTPTSAREGIAGTTPTGVVPPTLTMATAPTAAAVPRRGGRLRYAVNTNISSLDPAFIAQIAEITIGAHIVEPLFTWDPARNPLPLLVEEYQFNNDYTVLDLRLRNGLQFHDGAPLTAADVVASLNRFGKLHAIGRILYSRVTDVEALNNHTVRITFNKPSPAAVHALASLNAGILPKGLVEAYPDKVIPEIIGTGPYKIKEHVPGSHIILVRNEQYQPRKEAPNGFGGARVAYLDELHFFFVLDRSVRDDGLMTGEFDFAEFLSYDKFDQFAANPDLVLEYRAGAYNVGIIPNKKEPSIMTNVALRRAIQAAIDADVTARAYYPERFTEKNPAVLGVPGLVWYSDAAAPYYDQANPEKARQLLAEAGYAGQPVKWLLPSETPHFYNLSLAAIQQLEAVGFKIEQIVVDFASAVRASFQPDAWDIFLFVSNPYVHPSAHNLLVTAHPYSWDDPRKNELLELIWRTPDADSLAQYYREVELVIADQAAFIPIITEHILKGHHRKLKGYRDDQYAVFWNCWFEE